MRYGLPVTDGVELMSGSTPLPSGAVAPISNWEEIFILPFYYRKIVGNQIVEKTQIEKDAYDLAHPPTIEELQEAARLHLIYSDWYAARKADAGIPIPTDIQMSRAEAREIL